MKTPGFDRENRKWLPNKDFKDTINTYSIRACWIGDNSSLLDATRLLSIISQASSWNNVRKSFLTEGHHTQVEWINV